MTKIERCIAKVRTQKRGPGKKHWAVAAVSICKKSCKKSRKKK